MTLRLCPIAVLSLALACGGPAEPSATPTPTPTPTLSVTTPAPTASPFPTSTLPPGVDQLVTFSVADGKVTGPRGRVKVRRGTTLRIVVRSDKADHVHVHVYDKLADVKPGSPAVVTFRATITGVFEVELEDSKLLITRLQVA